MPSERMPAIDFLAMIQTLSFKEYDAQVSAFDDLDAKANWVIGYTSISAAAAGWLTSNHLDQTWPAFFLVTALGLFIGAIAFSFLAMLPREITGPPSASGVLERLEEASASEVAEEFIQETDAAIEGIVAETKSKANLVRIAYVFVIMAYSSLFVAIILLVLAMPNQFLAR